MLKNSTLLFCFLITTLVSSRPLIFIKTVDRDRKEAYKFLLAHSKQCYLSLQSIQDGTCGVDTPPHHTHICNLKGQLHNNCQLYSQHSTLTWTRLSTYSKTLFRFILGAMFHFTFTLCFLGKACYKLACLTLTIWSNYLQYTEQKYECNMYSVGLVFHELK